MHCVYYSMVTLRVQAIFDNRAEQLRASATYETFLDNDGPLLRLSLNQSRNRRTLPRRREIQPLLYSCNEGVGLLQRKQNLLLAEHVVYCKRTVNKRFSAISSNRLK